MGSMTASVMRSIALDDLKIARNMLQHVRRAREAGQHSEAIITLGRARDHRTYARDWRARARDIDSVWDVVAPLRESAS